MSIYSIHKIAQLVRKDADFRERMRDDPAAAIAEFRLSDEERRALLQGDVGRLAALGAHGYLLGSLANHRLVGLTPERYIERIHSSGVSTGVESASST
jgi:hypothetical protein